MTDLAMDYLGLDALLSAAEIASAAFLIQSSARGHLA